MIEVSAILPRGSVYLAGEIVKCVITFTNVAAHEETQNGSECLAWASVQIHCQCSVSETRVHLIRSERMSTEEVSTTGCDTSFVPSKGERGLTVLASTPRILFCDLRLAAGESKSYTFEDTIPSDAPPSYRGQAVKYSYKLTIGTQKFDHPTKLLRIPFRVLVLHGLNDISVYTEGEEVTPSNPFLKPQQTENSLLDIALQVLATITARKSPHSYNITNAKGKVAKFILFKQAYKLGEDIVGAFDFTDGTVSCVQFSVTLQNEEQISEECRRKPSQGTAVTSFVKHQEMCLHTEKTHINIPVPLTATPAFITDIVCLRWRLHFEFVTSCVPIPESERPSNPDESASWRGPPTLNVETMVWDLPIKIFPANPLHASSVTCTKSLSNVQI
ncbi:RAB6A-GEF complex partner protein 2-like [Mizuhopecten yessoensis]|uniref:Retrograde Golgi transport protein RGP1-like n=1 Tax=Mizuhopecten yessoensis TaxID=6573 RepID=A0A210QZ95_MIZYE|nr:RAB6A-GEF complex partner protein 2-like [Mizuhopecten yessoensis]OWF54079.1 Retrograde Golgi transport protein RGP1-like [Mizuhopecten yessoensis]